MITCHRYELNGLSFQTPGLKAVLQRPFIITLPADSPLCRLFESSIFKKTAVELPERPEVPLSIFTEEILENVSRAQEKKSESGLDLDELELDELTVIALKNGDVDSIAKLMKLSDAELMSIKGIGGGRLGKIRQALAAHAIDAEATDEEQADEVESLDSAGQ